MKVGVFFSQNHILEFQDSAMLQFLNLGGGFKYFLFSPLIGEMIQFH